MGKTYCVYRHTCLINGKVYIGATSQKPNDRWGREGCNYIHNACFTNDIEKYGWSNFKHEVLYTGLTAEEAMQKEIQLISLSDSTNPELGYNKSSGGAPGSGVRFTEARKAKVRAGRLGYKCSEETRRRISEAIKRRSSECKKKFATCRLGMPPWNKGITGKASHSYGVVFSEERRRHISEATTGKPKPGLCKEVVDTLTNAVYRTAKEAAEATGYTQSCIRHQCERQGKRSHRFKYTEREMAL